MFKLNFKKTIEMVNKAKQTGTWQEIKIYM